MKKRVTCCDVCGKEMDKADVRESKDWDLSEFRFMRKKHHCGKKCRMKTLTSFELKQKTAEEEPEVPLMGF